MGFYTNPVTNIQTGLSVSSQSASFTAAGNTVYQVNAASGAVTVTIPTSTQYQQIIVKKTDTSTNTVTLSGTINGSAGTLVLSKANQAQELYADGSGGWLAVLDNTDYTTLASSATTTGYLTATGAAKITIGTTAPSSPAAGDLWIDTN